MNTKRYKRAKCSCVCTMVEATLKCKLDYKIFDDTVYFVTEINRIRIEVEDNLNCENSIENTAVKIIAKINEFWLGEIYYSEDEND